MRGAITRVAGPVVVAENLIGAQMYEVVRVGALGLIGEVIRIEGDGATIQVYEDTAGLRVGDPVAASGAPLQVELAPGLLGSIFDGIQRPLPVLRDQTGDFIARGVTAPALDRAVKWQFTPIARAGDVLEPGDLIGSVPETAQIAHRVLVPPNTRGTLIEINAGAFSIDEPIGILQNDGARIEIKLAQKWAVRSARPYARKLDPDTPLITGQRVIDSFFPVTKGGTAIIPGGFGSGKTVAEQTLAKWADADIVIYVGCGERGNEMTDVLEEFPQLIDARTNEPLMRRTILIANTSNMPVAAREASIYTGITLAEFYRDMGYDVALMADSTSRWGEALREISGRLEEMPGEEGYPAYLATRLADFYERAGRVIALGKDARVGSVTVIGAVSPPGGDFSEPMTQNSLRVAGAFWGLDTGLARRRHFPAINWITSYSLYDLRKWFVENVASDWEAQTGEAMALLQEETKLMEIVQLVGSDALAEDQKALLQSARMVREDYLQQFAFHEIDAFCPPHKQYWMLRVILAFQRELMRAIKRSALLDRVIKTETPVAPPNNENGASRAQEPVPSKAQEQIAGEFAQSLAPGGVPMTSTDHGALLERALALPIVAEIARMKEWKHAEAESRARALIEQIEREVGALR
ncbi:MAG: V-type ATP synthase subunit A [Chloroflexi bacterium]|nr:V-type ATP synthase subunit A [Chloroflexota bacterium]